MKYLDRPYLTETIVLIQHTVTVQSSVIDIGSDFFNLFYTSMWYFVTVPTLEFDFYIFLLFLYIRLTFFSVLSPSHFILAPWQTCVLRQLLYY